MNNNCKKEKGKMRNYFFGGKAFLLSHFSFLLSKSFLLSPFFFLLSLVSCENDLLLPLNTRSEFVEVRAQIGSQETRVSQHDDNRYVFEDGDKIHIVSWYDNDQNVYSKLHKFENPDKPGSYLWWDDAVSTYSQYNDRWHTTPYLRWQNVDSEGNTDLYHCFLAWWPEDLVESTADLTSVPVTMTGDIKKDDLMYARWTGKRPADDNTINLVFNHLMARFDLHLNFEAQYSNVTDVVAKTEIATSGILNLLDYECEPVSDATAWQTFTPINFSNSYNWSATTICIPQVVTNLKVVLSFKADGQQKELTYTHPERISLYGKMRTTLVLEVGKDIVELTEVTVNDWTEHEVLGGEAEEI